MIGHGTVGTWARRLTVAATVAGAAMTGVAASAQEVFTDDFVFGDPNAPVEVIEYASLTCPHCRTFHMNVWPEFKQTYVDTGRVRFVFREFPLNQPDLFATGLARCGGEARYEAFIDTLFDRQAEWRDAPDPLAALQRIGNLGGVTPDALLACLQDETLGQAILDRRNAAIAEHEINATPTFVVDGVKHEGTLQMADWARILGDVEADVGVVAVEEGGLGTTGIAAIVVAVVLGAGAVFLIMRKRA